MPSGPTSAAPAAGFDVSSLLLASGNPHKRAELEPMFASIGIRLQTADECGLQLPAVAEDGESVEQIAIQKARQVARVTGRVCVADDTVLEVDALDGRPGVRTARFAGTGATAQQNGDELLRQMREVPDPLRTARFVCCLCLALPHSDDLLLARGVCRGRILPTRQGGGGFGYDALFWVDQTECSMAQMSATARQTLTHRALAFSQLARQLSPFTVTR